MATVTIPSPSNEPVLEYLAGSAERKRLRSAIKELSHTEIEIPLIIGGKAVRTGKTGRCVIPHRHAHLLATYHKASEKEVHQAIDAAMAARAEWAATPFADRAAVFLRMAALLSGPYRATLNAATILGQSKTMHQAEIDSACELIDFFRFNTKYAEGIYAEQPPIQPLGIWNRLEYRPLEGVVLAITPFNFTSIAGNLPTAPALMGNTVLWKPASSSVYSGYYLMRLFQAAGLPDGVINFIPGSGGSVAAPALASPVLSGVHFTGSTGVFQDIWRTIGTHIDRYKTYPRIVGETGGKDFIFVHSSADVDVVVANTIRGAFEYQGQKCSAASRAYIPRSLWPEIKDRLLATVAEIKMGDPAIPSNFMGAVIDHAAFETITGYIRAVEHASDAEILVGGMADDREGYFIEPTIVHTTNPRFETMTEEIFGPVLSIYVYPDEDYEATLSLCDTTSNYGLTGAVFANCRKAIATASRILVHAAGNFYINDKPTGAVVGQQPFGGSRASGTNDKAGSPLNLLRWVSPRTIKENFNPATDFRYPFMVSDS